MQPQRRAIRPLLRALLVLISTLSIFQALPVPPAQAAVPYVSLVATPSSAGYIEATGGAGGFLRCGNGASYYAGCTVSSFYMTSSLTLQAFPSGSSVVFSSWTIRDDSPSGSTRLCSDGTNTANPCVLNALLPETLYVSVAFEAAKSISVTPKPSGGYVTGQDNLNCGSDPDVMREICTGYQDAASTWAIAATPNDGYVFTGWTFTPNTSACASGGALASPCTITPKETTQVSAAFGEGAYLIQVVRPTHGRVTGAPASPGSFDCGPTGGGHDACAAAASEQQEIVFTAIPDSGYEVASWTFARPGNTWTPCDTQTTCSLVVENNVTTTVAFTPSSTQTITVDRPTTGYITSGDVDCGQEDSDPLRDDCSGSATYDTSYTLTGHPEDGYTYAWSGVTCAGGQRADSCTFTVGAAPHVTATPTMLGYLDLTITGTGTVTVSPTPYSGASPCTSASCIFPDGTVVTLTPTPGTGYSFGSVSGVTCEPTADLYDGDACTFTTADDYILTVSFVATSSQTITVARPSNGYVTGRPVGAMSDTLDCGPAEKGHDDCTYVATYEATFEVTAHPDDGYAFKEWTTTGAPCEFDDFSPCGFVVGIAPQISATFVQTNDLRITSSTGGGLTISGAAPLDSYCLDPLESVLCTVFVHEFEVGQDVALSPDPDQGYVFGSYSVDSGPCPDLEGQVCTVSMDDDIDVSATFLEILDVTVKVEGAGSVEVTPAPLSGVSPCVDTCTYTFADGTDVTLTPTADADYVFDSFDFQPSVGTPVCDAETEACTFRLTEDVEATAYFHGFYDLDLSFTGGGEGSVSVQVGEEPAVVCAWDDAAACEFFDIEEWTTITLTPSADGDSEFGGFAFDPEPSCTMTDDVCEFDIRDDTSVTASFAVPIQVDLTIDGLGSGSVEVYANGEVQGTCTPEATQPCGYVSMWGTSAWTFTPTADYGSTFARFTFDPDTFSCDTPGDGGGPIGESITTLAETPCTFTIGSSVHVYAHFDLLPTYDLAITIDGTGSVALRPDPIGFDSGSDADYVCPPVVEEGEVGITTATCTVYYVQGDDVTIVPLHDETHAPLPLVISPSQVCQTPDEGGGDGGDPGVASVEPGRSCLITLDANTAVTATFVESATLSITIDPEGSGGFSVSPAPLLGETPCHPGEWSCRFTFEVGTDVTVTPIPGPGYVFDAYTFDDETVACATPGQPVCVLTLDGNVAVTATFKPVAMLTVVTDGPGSVDVEADGQSLTPDTCPGAMGGAAVLSTTDCYVIDLPVGTPPQIVLTATADPDAAFDGFTFTPDLTCDEEVVVEAVHTGATCTFELTEDLDVTADFSTTATQFTLGLTVDGPGEVSVDDGSGASIAPAAVQVCTDTGSACEYTFDGGTELTLTAEPDSSDPAALADLYEWSGDCEVDVSDPLVCTLTLDDDAAVTATFGYGVTVAKNVAAGGTVTSDDEGPAIDCGTSCDEQTAVFPYDAVVVLTAVADDTNGYVFAGWVGCPDAVTNAPDCTVDLSQIAAPVSVEADLGFTVTLTKNGAAFGDVQSSPRGLACRKTCTTTSPVLLPGYIELTATPSSRPVYAFKGWTGVDCDGPSQTSPTCGFELTGPLTIQADFGFELTVVRSPSGIGAVVSSEGTPAINCAPDCSEVYLPGSSVTLTATPDSGYSFASWTGCTAGGTENICTFSMTAARSVTATFAANYRLTVTRTGPGTVTSGDLAINCGTTCSATFASGTVTLTATPTSPAVFVGWGGACFGSSAACTVTMDQLRSVTASFGYSLTVTKWGQQGGTVSSSGGVTIASPASINCGTSCATQTVNYASGTITLTAANASGDYRFLNWSGACTGTKTTCTVSMTANRSVTAVYGVKLTIVKSPTAIGTVTSSPSGINCGSTCTAYFAMNASHQASVTLTLKYGRGYSTSTWSATGQESISGSGTSRIVVFKNFTTVTINI